MALSGIKKIAFIASTSALGIAGVTGAGIAISNSVSSSNNENNHETNSVIKPNQVVERIDLNKAFSEVKEKLFSVYKDQNKQEKIDTNTVFANTINANQISLDLSSLNLKSNVETTISLDDKLNSIKGWNEGKLYLDLSFKQTNLPTNTTNKKFVLTRFKKASETLINVLEENDKNDFVLTLNPTSSTPAIYFTIEDLNQTTMATPPMVKPSARALTPPPAAPAPVNMKQTVSGLTSAFWASTLANSKDVAKVNVLGEVKLEKIAKESTGDDVYFHLVSTYKNQPIKLVKKNDENNTEEVLLTEIKIKNLLASDVSVLPNNFDQEKTKAFVETLAKVNDSKDFTNKKANEVLNRNLTVNLGTDDQETNANYVFVNPYVLNSTNGIDANKIGLDISISFGSDTNVKRYVSTNDKDKKELTDAGFSFHVYAKKLTKEDMNLMTNDIKTGNKLEEYLTKTKYSTFSNKPNLSMPNMPMQIRNNNNGFFVFETKLGQTPVELDAKKVDESYDGMKVVNLIVFADYSYTGIEEMKVSYAPSVTLFHLEKNEATA